MIYSPPRPLVASSCPAVGGRVSIPACPCHFMRLSDWGCGVSTPWSPLSPLTTPENGVPLRWLGYATEHIPPASLSGFRIEGFLPTPGCACTSCIPPASRSYYSPGGSSVVGGTGVTGSPVIGSSRILRFADRWYPKFRINPALRFAARR